MFWMSLALNPSPGSILEFCSVRKVPPAGVLLRHVLGNRFNVTKTTLTEPVKVRAMGDAVSEIRRAMVSRAKFVKMT